MGDFQNALFCTSNYKSTSLVTVKFMCLEFKSFYIYFAKTINNNFIVIPVFILHMILHCIFLLQVKLKTLKMSYNSTLYIGILLGNKKTIKSSNLIIRFLHTCLCKGMCHIVILHVHVIYIPEIYVTVRVDVVHGSEEHHSIKMHKRNKIRSNNI